MDEKIENTRLTRAVQLEIVGQLLLKEAKLNKAKAIFDEVLSHTSDVWWARGIICAQQKKWDDALRDFMMAARLDPQSVQPSLSAATALQELGRFQEALKIIDRILKGHGEISQLWLIKARSLAALKMKAEAASCIEIAYDLEPSKTIDNVKRDKSFLELLKSPKHQRILSAIACGTPSADSVPYIL